MLRKILMILIITALTAGAFYSFNNLGMERKLSMFFTSGSYTSHEMPEEGFQPEMRPDSGADHGHEGASAGALFNVAEYTVLMAWVVMAVYYLDKLVRWLRRFRRPAPVLSACHQVL